MNFFFFKIPPELSGFDELSLDISAVERKRKQARNSASNGRHTNDTANGGYSKSRKLTKCG